MAGGVPAWRGWAAAGRGAASGSGVIVPTAWLELTSGAGTALLGTRRPYRSKLVTSTQSGA
jgi:hypothetical protein